LYVLSISAISPAWAVRSPTTPDGTVVRERTKAARKPDNSDEGSANATEGSGKSRGSSQAPNGRAQQSLDPVDARLVAELAQQDRQVRAHEAAHQAVAGSLGGAASFTYRTGPDGKSYAVGGEVPIDMSGGRTPEETVARAEQIRAAALAPVDPSAQDLAIAAEASQMEAAAQAQLSAEQQLEARAGAAQAVGQAKAAHPDGAVRVSGRDGGGTTGAGSARPLSGVSTAKPSAPDHTTRDVSAQADVAIAAVEAGRVQGQGSAQQVARMAALAYRGL
jgi:hypothetical protein